MYYYVRHANKLHSFVLRNGVKGRNLILMMDDVMEAVLFMLLLRPLIQHQHLHEAIEEDSGYHVSASDAVIHVPCVLLPQVLPLSLLQPRPWQMCHHQGSLYLHQDVSRVSPPSLSWSDH